MSRTGGADRRREIITEAVRAFGARGYDGTTLDQVAEAVGVRKQSVLYYFPTKEDLFSACVAELSARVGVALSAALSSTDDLGWGRAEAVIKAVFALATEWPEFPGFVREASRHSPSVVQRVVGELDPLRKRAIAFLERGMQEGEFRRQDPVLLLFTIYTAVVGSLTEAGVLRAVGGGKPSRVALAKREQELLSFVRAALQP